MMQDCSEPPFTTDKDKRLPKGINIIGTERLSAPNMNDVSVSEQVLPSDKSSENVDSASSCTCWSYIFIPHMLTKRFQKWLDNYNSDESNTVKQPFFIHQTYRYHYKDKEKQQGVRKTLVPTVSGLVFLQGSVRNIVAFLKENFPHYHLVKDCSRRLPATIPDSVMRPFMCVSKTQPERITFLRDPFEKFARDHVKLRVLTGVFKGYEGYIIRIDRDRQLVFDFGGLAVAIRGVHNEDFEVVE